MRWDDLCGGTARPERDRKKTATEQKEVSLSTGELSCQFREGMSLWQNMRLGSKGMPIEAQGVLVIQSVECSDRTVRRKRYPLHAMVQKIVLHEEAQHKTVDLFGIHTGMMEENRVEGFPFHLRLYFQKDESRVKMEYTVRGSMLAAGYRVQEYGLKIMVPVCGKQYNRHVAFAGDTGLFYEGVQGMYTGAGSGKNGPDSRRTEETVRQEIYMRQQEGLPVYLDAAQMPQFAENVEDNAIWNRFVLFQDSDRHYTVAKQTVPGCACITAAHGRQSGGSVFLGSDAGAVLVTVADFHDGAPGALEVTGAGKEQAQISAWLYKSVAPEVWMGPFDVDETGPSENEDGPVVCRRLALNIFENLPGKKKIWELAEIPKTDVSQNLPE